MMEKRETIVVIGAGPAGLTAAYELASRSNKKVIVIEADSQVGGISRTVDYKGNKIDIGGHRFFSKSDWVLEWWQKFLPIRTLENEITTNYQNQHKSLKISQKSEGNGPHMLIRPRKSRIYYQGKLFDYPLKLNLNTLMKVGIFKSVKILVSVIYSRFFPRDENNLEDFFINRFGRELYRTFFKDYTRKVWGKHCHEISAEWGYQRIKGLSLRKIFRHYLTTLFYPNRHSFGKENTEQTLTEFFLYPQKGPGQLWESVAQESTRRGVELMLNHKVIRFDSSETSIHKVEVMNMITSSKQLITCDAVISTMPVSHLVEGLKKVIPEQVYQIGSTLKYRDFLIIGLLLDELKINHKKHKTLDDNWLYIQDSHVQVGRVQLFHNWSPHMVSDSNKCWIGAEYFCEKGDEVWNMSEEELIDLASSELETIGLIVKDKVLDGTVVKMPKAYPSYVGSYERIDELKEFFHQIGNLYLIGRNGTHRYNNQDHSMLTAKEAVDHILELKPDKSAIWEVNGQEVYHEEY